MISPNAHLLLAATLLVIGVAGMLTRTTVVGSLISASVAVNGAVLALAAGARIHGQADGFAVASLLGVAVAAQSAFGVALARELARRDAPADVDDVP